MSALVLRDADLGAGRTVDVRLQDGHVAEVGPGLSPKDDRVVHCDGSAVLPGLHDHHVHLLATAAAMASVPCGPPAVRDRAALRERLEVAPARGGWVRGVGYDEGVVGDLDRRVLDGMRGDVPVRIQHRSGALWVLNSAGLAAVGADQATVDGIERDAAGRPTGRLWRLDRWLRARLGPSASPDLAEVGRRLARLGITGVTDATPDLDADTARLLSGGAIPQRVTLLGDRFGTAPWKVVIEDHDLPAFDDLIARIRDVRPRPVALHCVTRASLAVAVACLWEVGSRPGDRVEHAAVCPPELAAQLAALRVTVVTQPTLIALRGDDYLDRAEPEDVAALWPFASLLRAGVRVGCSSDAPYGSPDPWWAMAVAAERRAPSGRVVGPGEAVPVRTALAGFLTSPGDPGGRARELRVGGTADVIVLDRSLAETLRDPGAVVVRQTIIGGRLVHEDEPVPA